MKRLLVFIPMICICLFFVGCQSEPQTYYTLYNDLTTKISHAVDQELKKEIPDLHPSGSGGRIKDKQVIFRAFQFPRDIDEASGRDLILRITNAYLSAFNSSEEFRPFIREYPFTNENLEINLFFKPREKISPGKIKIITLSRGNIQYEADNPNDSFKSHINGETLYRLMILHEESYEDAMQVSAAKG